MICAVIVSAELSRNVLSISAPLEQMRRRLLLYLRYVGKGDRSSVINRTMLKAVSIHSDDLSLTMPYEHAVQAVTKLFNKT